MDRFGDVLYNGYASTEVGGGTLATPEDLRAAPGTVGRPMGGTVLRILDDERRTRSPRGQPGGSSSAARSSSTATPAAAGKEVIDGLMSTGDLGHFDGRGRLFIDGRDDDMIVSGGENVFPQEVEDLLLAHPDVADAGVFGVQRSRLRSAAGGATSSLRRTPRRPRMSSVTTSAPGSRDTRFPGRSGSSMRSRGTSTGKLKRRELSARYESETAVLGG